MHARSCNVKTFEAGRQFFRNLRRRIRIDKVHVGRIVGAPRLGEVEDKAGVPDHKRGQPREIGTLDVKASVGVDRKSGRKGEVVPVYLALSPRAVGGAFVRLQDVRRGVYRKGEALDADFGHGMRREDEVEIRVTAPLADAERKARQEGQFQLELF